MVDAIVLDVQIVVEAGSGCLRGRLGVEVWMIQNAQSIQQWVVAEVVGVVHSARAAEENVVLVLVPRLMQRNLGRGRLGSQQMNSPTNENCS